VGRAHEQPKDEGRRGQTVRSTRTGNEAAKRQLHCHQSSEWQPFWLSEAYVEVERLRDQQKVLQQRLGPRKEEAVRIIGELATIQGKVKQAGRNREQTHGLDHTGHRRDNNTRGHNCHRGRGH
jgi:hypothetical protein